jgi:predicted signal transduction protein with EAL and GGDEF domain
VLRSLLVASALLAGIPASAAGASAWNGPSVLAGPPVLAAEVDLRDLLVVLVNCFVLMLGGALVAWRLVWIARDDAAEARKRAERAERLLAVDGEPLFLVDREGRIQDRNAVASSMLGGKSTTASERIAKYVHPEDAAALEALIEHAAAATRSRFHQMPIRLDGADNSWTSWEATVQAVAAADGETSGESECLAVRLRDVGERDSLRAELAAQRLYDPATGLPNRSLFLDRLGHALALAARRAEVLGVFLIDPGAPDAFAKGAATRDPLAAAIAHRIQLALRHGDSVGRLEDGRFAVLLEALHDVLDAAAVAERILDRFLPPLAVDGTELVLPPRIGIALSGGHERAEELLLQAEAALVAVRRENFAPYAIFDPSMTVTSFEQAGLEADLRRALMQGDLELLFQPIVRLEDGAVTAYEATPVWHHPRHEPLLTSELLALAEGIGLSLPLGTWTLVTACRQAREWHQAHPTEPLRVCLDVSARQFRNPGLAGDIARVLHEAGLGPHHLRLEIAQDLALEDIGATVGRLQALKGIGIQVAIDGFGTGYAALSFLQRCPVDALKIAPSYVTGLGVNPDDSAIVQAALAFARGLDIPAIADGVETAAQRAELRRLGCQFGQGRFFAPPLALEEFTSARDSVRTSPNPAGGTQPTSPADDRVSSD